MNRTSLSKNRTTKFNYSCNANIEATCTDVEGINVLYAWHECFNKTPLEKFKHITSSMYGGDTWLTLLHPHM